MAFQGYPMVTGALDSNGALVQVDGAFVIHDERLAVLSEHGVIGSIGLCPCHGFFCFTGSIISCQVLFFCCGGYGVRSLDFIIPFVFHLDIRCLCLTG